ncbi:acyl-CoA thioesterase [Mycolicibacterium sp. XJ1819]
MTAPAERLLQRLDLTPAGDDRFMSRAPGAPVRMYGGELASHALAAANRTVEGDRLPHHLHCVYLSGGDPDHPLEHSVTRVRDGRSFSMRRVDVRNDGRAALTATVGYHVPDAGFAHGRPMPSVPVPDDLPGIADSDDTAWIPWAARHPELEMRVVRPDWDDPLGRRRFWCRICHDEAPVDELTQAELATYLSDFTMIASIRLPHETPRVKSYLLTTLTQSLYFHTPFRASDWHLVDHWSPVAARSRGLAMSHVYTPDGELVMSGVQEALARRLPPDYQT